MPTAPASEGSIRFTRTGRTAAPRPRACATTSRCRRRPCPSPSPDHLPPMHAISTSAPGHGPNGRSTARRCRARADSRRARLGLTWGVPVRPLRASRPETPSRSASGTATTTRSIPSSNAATTEVSSLPGCGTSASRRVTTPISLAASRPRSGRPTTAPHEPSVVALASRANSSDVDPRTDTVLPRRRPPQGNRSARPACTGSTCPVVWSAGAAVSPLAVPTPLSATSEAVTTPDNEPPSHNKLPAHAGTTQHAVGSRQAECPVPQNQALCRSNACSNDGGIVSRAPLWLSIPASPSHPIQ